MTRFEVYKSIDPQLIREGARVGAWGARTERNIRIMEQYYKLRHRSAHGVYEAYDIIAEREGMSQRQVKWVVDEMNRR